MGVVRQLLHALVVLALSVAVYGQQCGPGDCIRKCVPVQWQRDLCLFYTRLDEWRTTLLQCGYFVAAISHDDTLPAEEQWREARQQWNLLRMTWEEIAASEGVIDSRSVDTTTVEGDTDSPLDELWQEDLEQWIEDYDNWRDHVDEQGPPLVSTPQYSISGPPYSAAWLQLFGNWTQDFVYYNTTYYDTC